MVFETQSLYSMHYMDKEAAHTRRGASMATAAGSGVSLEYERLTSFSNTLPLRPALVFLAL